MITEKCAVQSEKLSDSCANSLPILLLESNYITVNKTSGRDKNLSVATIVVDNRGTIVSLNRKFISTWSLSQDLIMTRCEESVFQFIAEQLKKTQSFLIDLSDVHKRMEEIQDLVELKDGRTFLVLIKPQWVDKKVVGRNYKFFPR